MSEPHRHSLHDPVCRDPVCDMTVDPASAAGELAHRGQTYYFCSTWCRDRFQQDPDSFLNARAAAAQPAAEPVAPPPASGPGVAAWTCPMHPEIVRPGPGSCPICGMALEPRTITATDEKNPELVDMQRRFRLAVVLTVPLVVIAMTGVVPARLRPWVELLLASPVVLHGGWPFFVRAQRSIRDRRLNMFTLIGLGVAVAYLYSLAAVVMTALAPDRAGSVFAASGPTHHGAAAGGAAGLYFEAAAAIVTLVLLGQVLELRARGQTGAAIRALLRLAPRTARRVVPTPGDAGTGGGSGAEVDIPVDQIRPGDLLRVRPGESIPTDAMVADGRSAVDESMITGESVPVDKLPGARVIGGTINGTGTLLVRAERVGAETLLARIVRMVSEAQRSRAPIQRLADTVSATFVPAVIAIALATFAVWAVAGPAPRLPHALVNAVAVLIIACPCALGLAAPMSVMVAMGKAAASGVLFRNAEALEVLCQADILVVDKTGTLTEGKPRLVSSVPATGVSEDDLVRLAAALERASEHPLGAAIVAEARQRRLAIPPVDEFQSRTGQGVVGVVEGRAVAVGNARLMAEVGGAVAGDGAAARADDNPDGALHARAAELRRAGQTVVFVARDRRMIGLLGVTDPVKPSAADAIQRLQAEGLRIVMMTGDTRITANAVGRALGITEILAEVLPADKAQQVKALQQGGRIVAMVGDGVNDAPALAQAQVGIAMGTGTDVAIASAAVTLVGGDLRGLLRARAVSRATLTNVKQNLFLAFVYNAAAIPIAAGVLYPVLGWTLSPMVAAAAMSLSSVSVIMNALRLRNISL